MALLAVCRRFRRIITPFFYRTLSISFGRNSVWSQDYIRKPRAIKHLVSSLRNNPTLGQYCRKLQLVVQENDGVFSTRFNLDNAMALVNSCPNTTQLHFTVLNRHPDKFWAILRTVTMAMPALESFYLSLEDALRLVPVC